MSAPLEIPVKLLDAELPMPSRAHPGDAGFDLFAREDARLKPGERALVPTGIALAIPSGWAGFVQPKSGLAHKQGLGIVNTPGLIDAGYRGEVRVALINLDPFDEIQILRGQKIAQLVILPVPEVMLTQSEVLPDSARGEGGFGSTGS